jgi:hypothetical protein
MPRPGESRADTADIVLHCHVRIIELCSGSVGEALFLSGLPWDAANDRAQEIALASLVANSPDAAEAFIGFCRVEAAALLRPREHILRTLAKELLRRRTMTGAEIDEVSPPPSRRRPPRMNAGAARIGRGDARTRQRSSRRSAFPKRSKFVIYSYSAAGAGLL